MTKKNRKKDRVDTSADEGLQHNPFATLLQDKERSELPEGPGPAEPEAKPVAPAEAQLADRLAALRKVVLRRQRKGRGGRTITLVEGLNGFSEKHLEELAGEMRKALGTGASLEDENVVLQCDLRERGKQWLVERGVKDIVLS